jgi:hypothetical protein
MSLAHPEERIPGVPGPNPSWLIAAYNIKNMPKVQSKAAVIVKVTEIYNLEPHAKKKPGKLVEGSDVRLITLADNPKIPQGG